MKTFNTSGVLERILPEDQRQNELDGSFDDLVNVFKEDLPSLSWG